MVRRKSPRLAAAFVVTVAAGCGEGRPPVAPDDQAPSTDIRKNPDGTCTETIHGNPPFSKTVDCPPALAQDAVKPTDPASPTTEDGWKIEQNSDGTCTAYGPDPCQHEGCNPPPPRAVRCPPNMPKAPTP